MSTPRDRIVQHLNLEQLPRIVDLADDVDQPIGDVHLVVNRQLDGDSWERLERAGGHGLPPLVLHVQINEIVAMPPVDGQNDQDEEVRAENQRL
jgi:hypothetical protein